MPDNLTHVATPYGTLHLIPDGRGGATGFLALPAPLTRYHAAPIITLPRHGTPVIDDPFLDADLRLTLNAALTDLHCPPTPTPPHVTDITLDPHTLNFTYAGTPVELHYDYGYFTVTWGDNAARWAVAPDGTTILRTQHTPDALQFESDLHAALTDRDTPLGHLLTAYLQQREQRAAHEAEHARYWAAQCPVTPTRGTVPA